ncbi:MAG: hypothetical protein LUH54_02380 [Firmicutes bacterium]|nr:hypothetical protein [Bacillota bacterium]
MKALCIWSECGGGYFELSSGHLKLLRAYAKGETSDGRKIDTRRAKLKSAEESNNTLTLVYEDENGLLLREILTNGDMSGGEIPYAKCVIFSNDDAYISTKSLTPLVFTSPDTHNGESRPSLWWNMHTRMLCVPYDNTMWLRYEALPLRSGRKSYDYTVLLSESTREGLLIGALDFDIWKNALVCSATDAYTLEARCGQADEGTHDTLPHGEVGGCEISSARFGGMYGCDYRALREG